MNFQVSQKYKSKIIELEKFLTKKNPFKYAERLYGLAPIKNLQIIHKPIKWSAQFKTPNKIIVDFRNDACYIALSMAHEYAHLLIRYYKLLNNKKIKKAINTEDLAYSIEQGLAILTQVLYEDYSEIRKLSKKHTKELMDYMNVSPNISQKILNKLKKIGITNIHNKKAILNKNNLY